MKTLNTPDGIRLMSSERKKHWKKWGRNISEDRRLNKKRQLRYAASVLISDQAFIMEAPEGWSKTWWKRMVRKTLKERLIIAGSLLAAEYDRLYYLK